MAKFRLGGSGPDYRGLGKIAGIAGGFEKSGIIYKTDSPEEILILRNLVNSGLAVELTDAVISLKKELLDMSWKELVAMGSQLGVFKPGIKRLELINRIVKVSC